VCEGGRGALSLYTIRRLSREREREREREKEREGLRWCVKEATELDHCTL